jgi:hypothetical protein
VVAILGLLDRRREPRPPSRAMVYLGIAALPVYVLHQPVVVEYAVIVTGSLVVILALYEGVVLRTRLTRLLFGMRTAPAASPPVHRPDPPVTPAR